MNYYILEGSAYHSLDAVSTFDSPCLQGMSLGM